MKKLLLLAIAILIGVLVGGCARSPENAIPVSGKRLIITMTVAGQINPNYYYYVALDTSGNASPGPLPVVGPPWGNGWGTGAITDYIVYNQLQPQGGYAVYRIEPNTNLLGSTYLGPPVAFILPTENSNKLQFTLDLGQIATTELPVDQLNLVNVNFITTDVVPLSPDYPGPKFFDGLGETGNNFITISVQTNQRYNNTQSNIEDPGDVRIPDLDIIDWSIEVQGN